MMRFRTWCGMFRDFSNSTRGCCEGRAQSYSSLVFRVDAFRSPARSKRKIAVDAEETIAQGLPARAKPNGIGVDNRVAAILEAGFTERKMVSKMGSSNSDASYP